MMKLFLSVLFVFLGSIVMAQDITGLWTTYKDGVAQSEVAIYEENGLYYGKIVKMINPPDQKAVCKKCKGELKNTPLVGLVIIKEMDKVGKMYSRGTILNPNNGKTYSCHLTIHEEDPDILIVKGSMGPFSQTQKWKRIK